MEILLTPNLRLALLFGALFLLCGIEFFFPLVKRNDKHIGSNLLLTFTLILTNFLFTSFTFFLAEWTDHYNVGLFQWIKTDLTWILIVSILFLDFWAAYLSHYLFHKYVWLWKFHSVHHSDTMVDVTTAFRQHPVESIIRILFHLSGMVMLGIPVWILLVYLTLSSLNAQLEHANIRIPPLVDRLLQYFYVTPNMHKVHHSKFQHETDTNYSNIFSMWDRIFGTYKSKPTYDSIPYGLDYLDKNTGHSFWQLIKMPFRKK